MVVMILVAGALYLAYVFSYLYLWTVSPQVWPRRAALPAAGWALTSAVLLLLSEAAVLAASRSLSNRGLPGVRLRCPDPCRRRGRFGVARPRHLRPLAERGSPRCQRLWCNGVLGALLQLELVLPLMVMAGFVLARVLVGRLDRVRRVTFDNLALLWHYAVGQGLLGLLLLHGFPRLVG